MIKTPAHDIILASSMAPAVKSLSVAHDGFPANPTIELCLAIEPRSEVELPAGTRCWRCTPEDCHELRAAPQACL
jgi:hypothetical protein